MGYTLKDFSIVWTDDGAELKFKSPYQVQEVPIPGPVVKMDYGTTRSGILQYYKTFDYNIRVTISNDVIPTVLDPSPSVFDQVLADPLTGELVIDEFGMNVYTIAEFVKEPSNLKDLRYE